MACGSGLQSATESEKSLQRASSDAAAQALAGAQKESAVAIWLSAPTPELQAAAAAALADALRQHGAKLATPIQAADASAAASIARAQGFDLLLRVHASVDANELTFAGDRIGTWRNFWDGATPQPQLPSAVIAVRAPVDEAVRALARSTPTVAAPVELGLQTLGHVSARLVALALLDVDGDGKPELAGLTPSALLVFRTSGEILARRDFTGLPERAVRVRAPCGGLVSPDGPRGHRLLYAACNQARGEAVIVDGAGIHPTGLLDGIPLAQGAGGLVSASSTSGTNLFGPELQQANAKRELPRSILALASNPRADAPAFLATLDDGQVQPLAGELQPQGAAFPGGIAAIADLDGDSKAELIVSSAQPMAASDHVRVLEPGQNAARFESDVPGAILAATAGDLDGDGKDEAIFAALQPDGSSSLVMLGVKR